MKPWTVLCQLLQFFSLYITPDVYLAVNAFGSLKETGTGFLKRLFFSIRNVLCKCPCLWNSTFLLCVAIYNIINPPSSGTRGVPVVKKQTNPAASLQPLGDLLDRWLCYKDDMACNKLAGQLCVSMFVFLNIAQVCILLL